MIITFTNVIGAIRNVISSVITTNLKMWLGFETSETLGREEVVNGDFATDLSNWTIELGDSTHTVTHTSNGARFKSDTTTPTLTFTSDTANIVSGRSYEIKVVISEYQGSNGIKIQNSATGNVKYLFDSVDTFTYNFTAVSNSSNPIQFYRNGANVDITIESVSLKELTQITPDKSGNNNVGELFTGKALEFNGSTNRVDFTSFTTPIKCAVFWYKPRVVSNFNSIIGFGGASLGTIKISNNQGNIASSNLSGIDVYVNGVQTTSLTLNQWQRVVVNFNLKTPLDLTFGWAFNNYGDCELSDIQLYNENLSTDDIAYDYANPQNLVTDRDGTSIGLSNLKGYWHLSEGAGSLVYDSSGEGNNGTINGATYEPAQPRIPQLGMMNWAKSTPVSDEVTLIPNPNNTSQDILGNAVRDRLNSFNLDGSGYAEVADDADLDFSGQLTLETWVKADFNNVGSIFNAIYSINGSIAAATGLGFYTDSTKVYYRIGGATNSFTYTQGKWYYLAIIRDSSNNFKFYKGDDGIISEVASGNNTVDFTSTESKFIGKDATNDFSRYYSNLVDDTRAYDRGLTLDEIENNYNAGLSAHTND